MEYRLVQKLKSLDGHSQDKHHFCGVQRTHCQCSVRNWVLGSFDRRKKKEGGGEMRRCWRRDAGRTLDVKKDPVVVVAAAAGTVSLRV